jgi:hypothetical protein
MIMGFTKEAWGNHDKVFYKILVDVLHNQLIMTTAEGRVVRIIEQICKCEQAGLIYPKRGNEPCHVYNDNIHIMWSHSGYFNTLSMVSHLPEQEVY